MTLDGNCDHTADCRMRRYISIIRICWTAAMSSSTAERPISWWNTGGHFGKTFRWADDGCVRGSDRPDSQDRVLPELEGGGLEECQPGWTELKRNRRTRQQPGRDILIGSRSLIQQLMKLRLIDELQLCIHPVVAGKGNVPCLRTWTGLFSGWSMQSALRRCYRAILQTGSIVMCNGA